MPQSTEEPTVNGQSMPKVQATQLITTAGNNDQIQDGSNSNNKGAVAAAVIVVLLIVVTAVVVTTVFLLCYLKRRNVTINCIKGKSGAMIAFGEYQHMHTLQIWSFICINVNEANEGFTFAWLCLHVVCVCMLICLQMLHDTTKNGHSEQGVDQFQIRRLIHM